MNCTQATMFFYNHTVGVFLPWVEDQGITRPDEIAARHVRQYIAEMTDRGLKDTTRHAHARAIRTLMKFWHSEGYITAPIKFEMPRLEKKRLPVLTAEQLQTIIQGCNVRDRAVVMFMADSGLRRDEILRLTWGDADMANGLVRVRQGKGKKDRSAVIGATTRRALLKYRRTLKNTTANAPRAYPKTMTVVETFIEKFKDYATFYVDCCRPPHLLDERNSPDSLNDMEVKRRNLYIDYYSYYEKNSHFSRPV